MRKLSGLMSNTSFVLLHFHLAAKESNTIFFCRTKIIPRILPSLFLNEKKIVDFIWLLNVYNF